MSALEKESAVFGRILALFARPAVTDMLLLADRVHEPLACGKLASLFRAGLAGSHGAAVVAALAGVTGTPRLLYG